MQLFLKHLCNFNQIRNKHKLISKMNKVYLRHLPEGERFDLFFRYKNEDFNVDRIFNFSRNLNETSDTFLSRIVANLEKKLLRKKKKVPDKSVNIEACLFLNREKVDKEMICKDIFQESNDVTLELSGLKFDVIINSPFIDNLALPKCLLANFPIYPVKFEHVFSDLKLSEFVWLSSTDKKNWLHYATGFMIEPDNSVISNYLKLVCVPKNETKEGPGIEVVSDVVVNASPGTCPFEVRQQFTKEKSKVNEFRVVTYNLLADLYCDSDYTRTVLHPYCPAYALEFDYRKQLILKEILGYNGDIICLQEVDKSFYKKELKRVLGFFNFDSKSAMKGGFVSEGVACFYNKEKFEMISNKTVIMSEHLETDPLFTDLLRAISTNEQLKTRFLERKTVLLLLALESKDNENVLIVANTHLYFHPDADHIRLLQGAMAIKFVEDYRNTLQQKFPNRKISVLFCGDFNSTPECGIFKLYTSGSVDSNCIDWRSNQEEIVDNLSVSQSLKLGSACGTPEYTNFTAGFADCLDYIFYDRDCLEVSQVAPFPSKEELTENTALPSVVFPSDHISLCADLKWK